MPKSKKRLIEVLEMSISHLDEEINDVAQDLPKESLSIIDRFNATVAELKDYVECLRQKGVLDEELVLIAECG